MVSNVLGICAGTIFVNLEVLPSQYAIAYCIDFASTPVTRSLTIASNIYPTSLLHLLERIAEVDELKVK